jgi:hypothetical protein
VIKNPKAVRDFQTLQHMRLYNCNFLRTKRGCLESIPVGALKLSIDEIYEDVDMEPGALEVRKDTETQWSQEEDESAEEEDALDW